MTYDSNPKLYREMSEPKPDRETMSVDLEAFYADVRAARVKHKIADVSMVIAMNGMLDGKEGRMLVHTHLGNMWEAESMLAQGLGTVRAEREAIISTAMSSNGRSR